MTHSAQLRGHYRANGGECIPGVLYLRQDADGWYDPDMQFAGLASIYVTAQQYRITPDLIGIEIVGCGGAPFLPDEGECERVGLDVTSAA